MKHPNKAIIDDGAEHTNAEHGCGRRVFPAALHLGRGGLTLTKKKRSPPIRMMPPNYSIGGLIFELSALLVKMPPVKVIGTPHQFYASTCVKPFGYAPYIEFSHIRCSFFTPAGDLKKIPESRRIQLKHLNLILQEICYTGRTSLKESVMMAQSTQTQNMDAADEFFQQLYTLEEAVLH